MEPNQHSLQPLTQWICDACGDVISSASDGWVEWYQTRDQEGYYGPNEGFRIVHHDPSCMYDERVLYQQNQSLSDMPLTSFTGANGLNYLLSKLELDSIADVPAYVEIIRRLHLPYYEEARSYHEDAVQDGYFDGKNELTRGRLETSVDLLNRYVDQEESS